MMSNDNNTSQDSRGGEQRDSLTQPNARMATNRSQTGEDFYFQALGEMSEGDGVLLDHENPFLNQLPTSTSSGDLPTEEAEEPLKPISARVARDHYLLKQSIVVDNTATIKKRMLISLAMVLCLSTVLIVSIAVPLSRRSVQEEYKTNFPNDTPTSHPTFTPSLAPSTFAFSQRKNVMQEYLESVSDKAALMDPLSPQGKAFEWIYEEDMTPMNNTNFIQRYVLAVFYYSTGGDDWTYCHKGDTKCSSHYINDNVHDGEYKYTYLDKTDECKWFGNECLNGRITGLDFAFELDGEDQGNNLQGRIPSEISELTGLGRLILSRNKITGTLPESIGKLQYLKYLFLYRNNVVSPLPESFYTLQRLEVANFGANLLDGQISPQFANMSSLTLLSLHKNNFSGTIPPKLGEMTNLETLNLYSNQLESTIPEEIYDALTLQNIDFYDNRLSGTISSKIGNLQELSKYAIDNNMISGQIPSEMGTLPLLSKIYLSYNKLTGTIPQELGNIEYPVSFKFESNDLNGNMPDSICDLKRTKASDGFDTLAADCAGTNPKVPCRCCTSCN